MIILSIPAPQVEDARQIQFINNERNGVIHSKGFIPQNDPQGRTPQGFRIDHNGNSEFNNIWARGNINATSGHFVGVSASEMNITSGTIDIGPLFVSNAQTGGTATRTYAATTSANSFLNTFLPEEPPAGVEGIVSKQVNVYYGGSYGPPNNRWELYSMFFKKENRWFGGQGAGSIGRVEEITFNTSNGTIVINAIAGMGNTIQYQVVINGGGAGSTFRLTGLPSNPDGLAVGSVYRDPYSSALYIVT